MDTKARRILLTGLSLFLSSLGIFAQHGMREGLIPPMDIPLNLSGNFGEFRSNHFHTGIDIKTQGKTGIPIKAVNEGYVSRIKISPYGYGNAIYIDHPDGYTSVYGHLKGIAPKIDSFLVAAQYELQKWTVDLYPGPNQLPVSQGELVAWSGNSGSSGGPHLHFEIRETESEFPLNPLLWDFPVADTRAPLLKGIQITPLEDSSTVLGTFQKQLFPTTASTGEVSLQRQRPITVSGPIGIGAHTIDMLNNNSNVCGIYRMRVSMDDSLIFLQEIDKLDFSTNRMMNAHADYTALKQEKKSIHRGFRLPYDRLPIYKTVKNEGAIVLNDDALHKVKVEVWDVHGNKSWTSFDLKREEAKSNSQGSLLPSGATVFEYDKVNTLRTDSCNVFVPEGRLYEDCYAWITEVRGNKEKVEVLSPFYEIGNRYNPLHDTYVVKIRLRESIPDSLHDKLVVLNYHPNRGRFYNEGGDVKRGWIQARVKNFGVYCVSLDTTAPRIKVRNASRNNLSFTISDDLSGIDKYEATADGEWIRMHYDPKRARLWYESSDGKVDENTKEFKLKVWDERGNLSTKLITF